MSAGYGIDASFVAQACPGDPRVHPGHVQTVFSNAGYIRVSYGLWKKSGIFPVARNLLLLLLASVSQSTRSTVTEAGTESKQSE